MHAQKGTAGGLGHIVDVQGKVVKFHGVNKMGTEYACVQGNGIFDGPIDQASIDAMLSWKVNVVRIPLNEDCWLAINGVNPAYAGANYQSAIAAYVDLLKANGIMAILELHWAAPGNQLADRQLPMPNADHTPKFWSEVAAAYAKSNATVVFDLYNEPTVKDWNCWAKGGSCAQDAGGNTYNAAGMESLIKVVRDTGAQNLVMLSGLAYANDLSGWLSSVGTMDAALTSNVAASWHQYDFNLTSGCPSKNNAYLPIFLCSSGAQTANAVKANTVLAAGFPVVLGEVGISAFSSSTASAFSSMQIQQLLSWHENLLDWMDLQEQGYLGWSWNTGAVPALISDTSAYTPSTHFGAAYKNHLSGL